MLLAGGVSTQVPSAASPPVVSVAVARASLPAAKPSDRPIGIAVVLTSEPISLGKNVGALVFGQDLSDGLQLFTKQPALFQGLKRGDRVAAWGVISSYGGMPELQVAGLKVLAHGAPPAPREVLAANLASGHNLGKLVRVAGRLLLTQTGNGARASLQDRSGSVAIFLPRSLLDDPDFLRQLANGDRATVTGVAMRFGGPYEVEPRGPQDIVIQPRPPYRIWAVSALLLVLVAGVFFLWWRRRESETQVRALGGLLRELRLSQQELQVSEEKLRQMQKMDAIGRLAGGIAHDFNNMLTVIGGQAQLLRDRLPENSSERRRVDEIMQASDRAATLTRQLLAFSRKQLLQARRLDLNTLVQSTSTLLQRTLGEDIRLMTRLSPGLGAVMADPGQLDQILLNLTINARDAMPHGGALVIETGEADLDQTFSGEAFTAQPGRYVMLSVRDTGCGMDEATRARIFEPFFTTKPVGKGTGLGLATVYGIVKQSGGYIAVESAPGEGTTVRIYLSRLVDGVGA